jgi:2-polyprenyl-6-hydroxyphenyl methylase/3-demethylubiquinone-9 3-methyltransferase
MNPVRMRFIREKLLEVARDEQPAFNEPASASVLKGLDVLDVGCGGGLLSEAFFLPSSRFKLI